MREHFAEKFWESLHFEFMDRVKIKPLGATWNYKCLLLILFLDLLDLWDLVQMHLLLHLVLRLNNNFIALDLRNGLVLRRALDHY